ncbi:MAG: hypothetical protein Q8N59_01390 [bacterium]|nr:hypothetical protein [bacterium]
MVNKELINYIQECRKLGHSDSQIRNTLLKEGWSQANVLEAMFKYAKSKKTPRGLFLVGLIVSGLLIALMIVGIIFMLNDIEKISAGVAELTNDVRTSTQDKDVNETCRNDTLGFEIEYPRDIFKLDAVNTTLTHTLKNFHKYSLKDGADLGLAEDIKIVFKKDISECDNANNTIEEIAEPFVSGNLRGLKYEMGAEGEGAILYCFRDDTGENIFMIVRYFLSEVWSTELPKQADFIPSQKQVEIFDNILASFKLI